MEISESICIGILLKTHGYKGDLLLKSDPDFFENFEKPESVFLLIDGIMVPFLVHSFYQTSSPFFLIHFEGMNDLKLVSEHIGREVFIPSGSKIVTDTPALSIDNFVGFTLFDQEFVEIGLVKEVSQIPGNPLLIIASQKGSRMIPFHTDLIMEVDKGRRIIRMHIPEGI